MKVGPVSGDLLVKLALGAVAVGVAVYVVRQMQQQLQGAAATAAEWAGNVATGLNPVSPDNWAYSATNAVGGAVVSDPDGPGKNADGSWSLGGWVYDVTH